MLISGQSDDHVPHLAEQDARHLAQKICERVFARGSTIERFGVTLDTDGMWFAALVNGKEVTARTGQGNFTYDAVATDLILASTDRGWNRLTPLAPEWTGVKQLARRTLALGMGRV